MCSPSVAQGIGKSFHKLCFKCEYCNSKIEPGAETDKGGKLTCKNCGNATEGFRGASAANVASFKAAGDVRPSGGAQISSLFCFASHAASLERKKASARLTTRRAAAAAALVPVLRPDRDSVPVWPSSRFVTVFV